MKVSNSLCWLFCNQFIINEQVKLVSFTFMRGVDFTHFNTCCTFKHWLSSAQLQAQGPFLFILDVFVREVGSANIIQYRSILNSYMTSELSSHNYRVLHFSLFNLLTVKLLAE